MPYLTMLWVWPPQTSISTHGRVTARLISTSTLSVKAWSRYSSRYFMHRVRIERDLKRVAPAGALRADTVARWNLLLDPIRKLCLDLQFGQLVQLFESLVSALGFGFVHFAESKAHVDQDVIAAVDLGCVLEADLLDDPAKIGLAHPHTGSVLLNFNY